MMKRHETMPTLLVALLLTGAAAGCGPGDAGPEERAWRTVDTLITTESGVVGDPSDLELGSDGTLYVLDRMNHRIHRIGEDGRRLASLGAEGAGPGELQRPTKLAVAGDTLLVVDAGNGRLQALDRDGEPLGTRQLPPHPASGLLDVAPDGSIAAATLGGDSAVAALYGPGGPLVSRFGTPVIEQPSGIDLNELRAQAAAGEVPDFFRVNVEPRISPDGDLWISFSADGAVRKYARDGSPLAEHDLEGPEVERIFDAYVRANAEAESGVHPLNYVADFEVVGDEVWVLLNLPEEEPGQVLVLDDGADVDRRIRLPGVVGAGRLAVDTARDRLYLGVPDLAQVLAVSE